MDSRLQGGINLGHIRGGRHQLLTSTGFLNTENVRFLEFEFLGISLIMASVKPTANESDSHYHIFDIPDPDASEEGDDDAFVRTSLTHYPAEDSTYDPELTGYSSDFNEDNYASRSVAQVLPSEICTSGEPKLREALK